MFLGLILACGLNIPQAVEGCMPVPSNVLFRDEATCQKSLVVGAPVVIASLPEGAYIDNAVCFQVDRQM